jgi:peptidoglycan/LPS O-acetylase OafA/YrhL
MKYLAAFVLLSGNWSYVFWGYPHSVMGPLWSVSIEEQFYLGWPLLVRRWAHRLVIVAFALLTVSLLTRLILVLNGAIHPQVWCNTFARLDPIACGALLALRAERCGLAPSPSLRVALVLFGFAVFTAAGRYGDFVGNTALLTYPAVTIACVAFILGVLGLPLPARRHGIVPALAYLGRISYGLYVFHLFFIELFAVPSAHSPIARLTRTAAALMSTIAAAALSYHLLETPFLRAKEKFARVRSRPV